MAVERLPVAVVGGGQAGLAVSRELTELGVVHAVLERGRVGQAWRDRWDSFCLVTPNWTVQLPGHAYDGDDPDGFMPRDAVVAHLARYASGFGSPIREGVDVTSVAPLGGGSGFTLETSSGTLEADAVVIATGTYRRPHRPAALAGLPPSVSVIDAGDYRSERDLPDGAVLVVGSGQTGCQLAEELHAAGRRVVVACGRAPWLPRRIGDRDLMWWALETGFLDAPVGSLPAPEARLWANLLATGHGGGHDLHLRVLRDLGVTLTGHLAGADDSHAYFAPDLADSVAWGDERYRQFAGLVRRVVAERGLDDPGLDEPPRFDGEAPERLSLRDVGVVVFACGFRPDYRSWIAPPEAFDELGFPRQRDGASTVVPGLHFVGVHFLRKRKSALLIGVGEDAAIVARSIAG